MSHLAHLSLGSNLGNREQNLRAAIAHLNQAGRVVRISSFYETEPVEFTDQPWFLNCAVAIETTDSPAQLLKKLLIIEKNMGRNRSHEQRKGPRKIDIDILLFEDEILDSPHLTIPHPAMHERRFVLEPLAEVAPQAQHPLLKKSIQHLLADLPEGQTVRRIQSKTNDQRQRTNDRTTAE